MSIRSATAFLNRVPVKLLLALVGAVLLLNIGLFAGRALGQFGDIGSGPLGFHVHMACRLVQTGHAPAPIGEAYGSIRVLDVHPGDEPGTTARDSCDPRTEQYIRVTIDHEADAHP